MPAGTYKPTLSYSWLSFVCRTASDGSVEVKDTQWHRRSKEASERAADLDKEYFATGWQAMMGRKFPPGMPQNMKVNRS